MSGVRRVEPVMGTVFSFDVRGPGGPAVEAALGAAVALLHRVDRVFSTFRPESAISRIGRGEVRAEECGAEVAEVLGRCAELRERTGGYFSERAAGGRLDPSGLVKGWAVAGASRLLAAAGAADHCVNGGGDVQVRGEAAPGRAWRVGIADPLRRGRLAAVVAAGPRCAVATSGTAERGAHVVDPWTGAPAVGIASLTLVGEDIAEVDALATAALAMGPAAAREWCEAERGVAAFAILPDGTRWSTRGFPFAPPDTATAEPTTWRAPQGALGVPPDEVWGRNCAGDRTRPWAGEIP